MHVPKPCLVAALLLAACGTNPRTTTVAVVSPPAAEPLPQTPLPARRAKAPFFYEVTEQGLAIPPRWLGVDWPELRDVRVCGLFERIGNERETAIVLSRNDAGQPMLHEELRDHAPAAHTRHSINEWGCFVVTRSTALSAAGYTHQIRATLAEEPRRWLDAALDVLPEAWEATYQVAFSGEVRIGLRFQATMDDAAEGLTEAGFDRMARAFVRERGLWEIYIEADMREEGEGLRLDMRTQAPWRPSVARCSSELDREWGYAEEDHEEDWADDGEEDGGW